MVARQSIALFDLLFTENCIMIILVPRGRAPLGQHQESRPGLIPEVRDSRISRHYAHARSQS